MPSSNRRIRSQRCSVTKKTENAEMKAEMSKMKKSLAYTNEADIDARIRNIEYKMQHETLNLKDEKAYMKEIAELKKNKPKLSQLSQLSNKVENLDAGTDLQAKKRELNEQFSILYEKKKGISEKFKELQDSRSQKEGDLGQVREQKDAKQTKIRELIEERNKLRDAFNEEKRQYKVYQDEQRRIRNERMGEERKREQEARRLKQLEREVESLDEQPFVDELTRIDQCTRYCKSMLPQEVEKKEEEKKEVVYNNKDKEVVLLTKEARAAEEFFFAPTKVKSKKGKKQAGVDSGDASKKKLNLNMSNFADFQFLNLAPPMYVADIPDLLVKLEEKKQHFDQKVKDWEENKEEMKRKILDGTMTVAELKGGGKEEDKSEEKEEEKEEKEEAKEDEEKADD